MKRILLRIWSRIDRLGVRLALVLAVALLPLMIVSITRSQSLLQEAAARSEAALVGETLDAVQDEIIIIERALAVAQSLSRSIPFLLDDLDLCNKIMRDQLRGTEFSFAGFYDVLGSVPCSSAAAPFSFGMSDNLLSQISDPKPTVLVNQNALASGTSVIFATYPVFSDDGTLVGFTSISVPHINLQQTVPNDMPTAILTLNAAGTVLTAPGTLDDAQLLLPQLQPGEDIIRQPTSFRALGHDGVPRLYALIPVVDGELYALASWPSDLELGEVFYLSSPEIFPALMWLASLVVAWFAASLYVTRPVIRLGRAMRSFAATRETTTTQAFSTAPGELRGVAETFIGMTDTILRDEAKIEDALRQKDILLREVHHRAKNNLQLIASIMSMQMRQSRSKEVKHLMQGLHDRVNSLATIHRNLYQTSGQVDISMDEHLGEIVRQVIRMAAERASTIKLKTEFDKITLHPDQAVPLSLFVTEAMTNALKYIGSPDGGAPQLSVTLHQAEGDIAEVMIINSVSPSLEEKDDVVSSGLGSELMEAFSDQLSGTFSATPSEGQFKVRLSFPIET